MTFRCVYISIEPEKNKHRVKLHLHDKLVLETDFPYLHYTYMTQAYTRINKRHAWKSRASQMSNVTECL